MATTGRFRGASSGGRVVGRQFYPTHPEVSVYIDIATPPEWDGSRLTFIDLDLDVIRRLNGSVEIIDQDDFEENRTAYDYPQQGG